MPMNVDSRQLSARSRAALRGVHPDLVLVISRAVLYSEFDFGITEGLRTIERQRELVQKQLSKTFASKHLVQPDGYGHAVDVIAVGDLNGDGKRDHQDKAITWDRTKYAAIASAMKTAAAELGIAIRWGGDFKSFFDGPHFELA